MKYYLISQSLFDEIKQFIPKELKRKIRLSKEPGQKLWEIQKLEDFSNINVWDFDRG